MQRLLSMRSGIAVAAAVVAAFLVTLPHSVGRAASPSSGTLSPGATVTWQGFAGPATSPANTTSCLEGVNCDTFTLKLAPGDYTGKRVRVKITWSIELDDYDFNVYAGSTAGPQVADSGGPPPSKVEEDVFEINRLVNAEETYVVRTVYYAVGPSDPYAGTATVETIPVDPTRTAVFIKDDATGIKFSRNRTVYATGAGQDVEPSARVDYLGNAYVGGIRGLTGGNDLWRFDLNPNSPTFDPFLTAATAVFDTGGNVTNPAYKGQPDSLSPDGDNDLGGDGGGDLDLAVGFAPPHGASSDAPPYLAATSLVAANVSSQRSVDRGDTFQRNPVGNTIVPVDDREWQEFLGGETVYLGYRELVGLQVTAKFYINRSDDGGLTYGPAVLAAIGGNTTGNVDVDQRDGTVYFAHQGPSPNGNQVRVAIGQSPSLAVPPLTYTTVVAATGKNGIANLFPIVKVAKDGTVYVITPTAARRSTWRTPKIRAAPGRSRCASAISGVRPFRSSRGSRPGTGPAASPSRGMAQRAQTARMASG